MILGVFFCNSRFDGFDERELGLAGWFGLIIDWKYGMGFWFGKLIAYVVVIWICLLGIVYEWFWIFFLNLKFGLFLFLHLDLSLRN